MKISDWKEILSLKVANSQKHYIESSSKCLEDACTRAYNMDWDFYGVYVKEALVGFAMHGIYKNVKKNTAELWLDRFMIDERFQGKGYGKSSLLLICEEMFKHYKTDELYLSVHDDNEFAIKFYLKAGFVMTGEKDPKGELVMRLTK